MDFFREPAREQLAVLEQEEKGETLEDVRLSDGSPVHFALVNAGDQGVMDKRAMEEAKDATRKLFEEDPAFVFSLKGMTPEEAAEKINIRLAEMENEGEMLQ